MALKKTAFYSKEKKILQTRSGRAILFLLLPLTDSMIRPLITKS